MTEAIDVFNQPAALTALKNMRRSRTVSFMLSGWIEPVELPPKAGGTAALCIGCPGDFVAVRLGFANVTGQPWRLSRIIGCASSAYNDYINPTGGGTWIDFTAAQGPPSRSEVVRSELDGREIIVAGTTHSSPNWTWTNWAPISSLPPSGNSEMRVIMLRALVPSEQRVCYAVGQLRSLLGNRARNSGFDWFIGGLKFDIDKVSTTTGDEPTITWIDNQLVVGSLFPIVQFLTKAQGVTGLVTGDSHQQGVSTVEQHTSFIYRSVTRSMGRTINSVPLGFVNCSEGGLTSSGFFGRFQNLIEPVRPSYVVLPGWTYNDKSGSVHADQSAMDAFLARLILALEQCQQHDILPIVTTPFPRDPARMGPSQVGPWRRLRREILDLKQAGLIVLDASTLLGQSSSGELDGTYLPFATSDGAHPGDEGHEAVSRTLDPFFEAIR